MHQFTVPQFIVEDKIVGPVTVRQFIVYTGAILISHLL